MAALADAAGDVDILVNNAGDIPAGTVETLTDEDWRRGFDLKVFGYINLTRAIYTRMKNARRRRHHQRHRQFRRELGL